jgi:hypothetical protein
MVTVTFLTSGRENSALKVLVAVVCRSLVGSADAVFESISAVESSADWKAARVALARV